MTEKKIGSQDVERRVQEMTNLNQRFRMVEELYAQGYRKTLALQKEIASYREKWQNQEQKLGI